MSNKEKINNLREELNRSIAKNEDYSIILDLSIKLDKLIAEYYDKDIDVDNLEINHKNIAKEAV